MASHASLSSHQALCTRLLLILAIVSTIGAPAAEAQQSSVSVQPLDKIDASAYRILFRRAVLYKDLADQADASHTPKPHLRNILASRFELSDFDGASLDRLALAYRGEIAPLHQQTLTTIRQFHTRFPLGIIPKGADASPPPELSILQQQEDAMTLRYRDLLRSSMHEADFQKLHAKVRATFGGSVSTN